MELINATLRGHFNYYGIAGNAGRLASFRDLTLTAWKRSLSRRSQKGRLTWEAFLAPAGVREDQDQLPSIGSVRAAVIRLDSKSRMREICTYGSVVGPVWEAGSAYPILFAPSLRERRGSRVLLRVFSWQWLVPSSQEHQDVARKQNALARASGHPRAD